MWRMKYDFVRATRADLPAIVHIYNEAILTRTSTADLHTFTPEQRAGWFDQFDDRHPIWLILAAADTASATGVNPTAAAPATSAAGAGNGQDGHDNAPADDGNAGNIASDGSSILGWVSLEQYSDRPAYDHTAEISIYLDQKAVGHGIGSAAMSFVESQLARLGITAVISRVFARNAASRALFTKFGYEQWGHYPRVAVLDGEPCDLLVLGKRYDADQQA